MRAGLGLLGIMVWIGSAVGVAQGGGSMGLADTWNLGDLYASEEAFMEARTALAGRLPDLEKFRGRVSGSAANLRQALELYFDGMREFARISSYATMRSDEDTRVPEALAARQEVQQLGTDLAAATAWLAPEVLAMPSGAVSRFLNEDPALAPYRFFLEDLERQRAHTLSPDEEKLLAAAGSLGQAPSTFYTVLANAELPFPEIELADGRKARLDQAGYGKLPGSRRSQ